MYVVFDHAFSSAENVHALALQFEIYHRHSGVLLQYLNHDWSSMPKKDPDHAYDINRLNMWFAISSILLFVFFVWMMWADFARGWKHLQAEFRRLDLAKTKAAATQELQILQSSPDYQKIQQELQAAE